jgi:uncharacterized protein GlcG (DUF336 family)
LSNDRLDLRRPAVTAYPSRLIVAVLLQSAVPGYIAAQATVTDSLARRIIDGCVSYARAKQQGHAIAVYDAGGNPVAILRMDGNPAGIGDFAMQKAAAVARWQFSTAAMADAARSTPGFASAPFVVTVPGGVPILSTDGRFLGAVGVSGESPADDVACAEAGVRNAGLRSRL